MSKYRVYFKGRHIATIWAFDEQDATWKVHQETGLAMELMSARELFEHDKGSEL